MNRQFPTSRWYTVITRRLAVSSPDALSRVDTSVKLTADEARQLAAHLIEVAGIISPSSASD